MKTLCKYVHCCNSYHIQHIPIVASIQKNLPPAPQGRRLNAKMKAKRSKKQIFCYRLQPSIPSSFIRFTCNNLFINTTTMPIRPFGVDPERLCRVGGSLCLSSSTVPIGPLGVDPERLCRVVGSLCLSSSTVPIGPLGVDPERLCRVVGSLCLSSSTAPIRPFGVDSLGYSCVTHRCYSSTGPIWSLGVNSIIRRFSRFDGSYHQVFQRINDRFGSVYRDYHNDISAIAFPKQR